jgi:hypothetical protein
MPESRYSDKTVSRMSVGSHVKATSVGLAFHHYRFQLTPRKLFGSFQRTSPEAVVSYKPWWYFRTWFCSLLLWVYHLSQLDVNHSQAQHTVVFFRQSLRQKFLLSAPGLCARQYPGVWSVHSFPCSVDVKNAWSFTSAPPRLHTLRMHTNNLIFYLNYINACSMFWYFKKWIREAIKYENVCHGRSCLSSSPWVL